MRAKMPAKHFTFVTNNNTNNFVIQLDSPTPVVEPVQLESSATTTLASSTSEQSSLPAISGNSQATHLNTNKKLNSQLSATSPAFLTPLVWPKLKCLNSGYQAENKLQLQNLWKNAQEFYCEKDYPEALELFEQALGLFQKGHILVLKNHAEFRNTVLELAQQAIEICKEQVKRLAQAGLEPQNSQALYSQAQVFYRKERYLAAMSQLKSINYKFDPELNTAVELLSAACLFKLGHFQQALTAFSQIYPTTTEPEKSHLCYKMAICHKELQQYEQAAQTLSQVQFVEGTTSQIDDLNQLYYLQAECRRLSNPQLMNREILTATLGYYELISFHGKPPFEEKPAQDFYNLVQFRKAQIYRKTGLIHIDEAEEFRRAAEQYQLIQKPTKASNCMRLCHQALKLAETQFLSSLALLTDISFSIKDQPELEFLPWANHFLLDLVQFSAQPLALLKFTEQLLTLYLSQNFIIGDLNHILTSDKKFGPIKLIYEACTLGIAHFSSQRYLHSQRAGSSTQQILQFTEMLASIYLPIRHAANVSLQAPTLASLCPQALTRSSLSPQPPLSPLSRVDEQPKTLIFSNLSNTRRPSITLQESHSSRLPSISQKVSGASVVGSHSPQSFLQKTSTHRIKTNF